MIVKRLVLYVIIVLLGALTRSQAAEIDETLKKLAAEAAKGGNVIWYESSPDDQADKILAAFSKRFPNVKLEHVRDTGGNTVGGRIVQESQGGTRTADVATTGAAITVPLLERKLIKAVDWQAYGLNKELAPTPYGVVVASVIYVIVYNTALVKEADAPKTWDDLLNPRWDGKIGIWVRGEAQGSLTVTWGVDRVLDYVRKMNALHPVLLPSTFPLAQQVAAGELLVGLGLNHTAQPPIRRGAPIKVVSADPAPINNLYNIIPVKAKNPSGGELLAVWLATPEGAKVYEDATDRGNPYVPGTKTYTMLQGHKTSQFSVGEQANEAAIVARINKMIETRETQ